MKKITVKRERLVKEFCRLVSLDCESFHEREMADYLKKELMDLGLEVSEDDAGEKTGGNAGNVYGLLPSNICGEDKGEPILFSAHMDTVKPGIGKKAVLMEDEVITSDGTTVLGADDLAGVAEILEMLRVIRGIVVANAMNEVHSVKEYTTVSELTKAAELVLRLAVG